MKRIALLSVCMAAFFFAALNCEKSNPAGPQPGPLVGNWTGEARIHKPGANHPDTFGIRLNIAAGSAYTLVRGTLTHASSGDPWIDSLFESGTWSESGSTLTLTPTRRKTYEGRADLWDSSGALTPTPVPVSISGNSWTIIMADWRPGYTTDTIPYPAVKK